MLLLIVAIVLITLGILALITRGYAEDPDGRLVLIVAGPTLLVCGVLVLVLSTIRIVQGYEVGVPVAFGKVGKAVGPGVHVVLPWVHMETYPVRPFSVPDITIKARSSQGGQFTVVTGARWSTSAAGASNLYMQVRTGDEKQITETVVDKALGQTIQNVYSTLQNADAINQRAAVEDQLLSELQAQLKPFGIQANNVFLREVEPDKDTAETIARLTSQEQATKVAVASQQTAKEEAKAREITAKGLQAAANQVPEELTPTQLQALCLQAWERQVAAATSKGITLYTTPCAAPPQAIVK